MNDNTEVNQEEEHETVQFNVVATLKIHLNDAAQIVFSDGENEYAYNVIYHGGKPWLMNTAPVELPLLGKERLN